MSVVFDVGGVLLDWQPERYLAQCAPEHDDNLLAQQTFRSAIWRDLDAGRVSRTELANHFAATTVLAPAEIERVLDGMPDSLLPIAPLQQFARDLHADGVPVYLLSNMPKYVAAALDARHALPDVFRERVFSYAELTLKPEPKIYQVLLQRGQLRAEQCIFIDDSLANLEEAAAQGMHTVHMPDVSQASAEVVIASVSALL